MPPRSTYQPLQTTPGSADADGRALSAARELLTQASRRRIALSALEEAVVEAVPDVPAGLERHGLLARVIAAQVDEGRVALPKTTAAWTLQTPPLPRWLTLTESSQSTHARRRRRHPWHPALEWATGVALSDTQFDALVRIQDWIVDEAATAPQSFLRERSVDIFENDKRLEALLGGSLFAPGRLTLELLRCLIAYPPLAVATVAGGTDWLVVENATTFRTLYSCARDLGGVGLLIYGAGGQAAAGLPALLADHERPGRVSWFGDIDRDGLRFAVGAAGTLAAEGLDVRPHRPLYRLLARRGITHKSRAKAVSVDEAARLAAWLDDDHLAAFAAGVLTSGRRAMQEQVSTVQLRELAPNVP